MPRGPTTLHPTHSARSCRGSTREAARPTARARRWRRRRSASSQLAAAAERLSERDLVRVLEVGADGQPGREPRDHDLGRALAHRVGKVEGGRLAGGGRVCGHHDLAHTAGLDAVEQLSDAQVLGVDAVDRRQRPAKDVVAAAELVRALDRDHVARLLDDADHLAVAALVLADPAARADGEVEAHLAVADGLLDLTDRVGERERLLGRQAEDVEREPLRRALADAGHARELGDQAVDWRGEHRGLSRLTAWAAAALASPLGARQAEAAQAAGAAQAARD